MWLFVWDSEPSKIFVGDTAISKCFLWDTQIRPSWFNLTTDLRWETLAWLQALGRDWITNYGAYTLNSNWLKNGNSTNNRCALNYDASQLDLTGKKLTLYEEWTISDTGYYAWKVGIRCTNPAMNTYYLEAYLNGWDNAASPCWMWILGQSKFWPWTPWSWDYTLKYEIDFSTWETSVISTWAIATTWTYTMSSSEISGVLTGLSTGYIRFYATNYQSGHQHTLKLVSIKVQ
jgi:hypothetical protein